MDVGSWLRSLGLERYEPAFRENEIDGSVLPSLTAEDLKDLGVTLVGHRRKLLDAIAGLQTRVEPGDATPTITASAESHPMEAAERRQVTVLFSDLVGSTVLSGLMDPEDLRELISAYQRCVADVVARYHGFIAKYLGDGVLVYFGYPQAHEDDAERAVGAGLDMAAAIAALEVRPPLQARVGIATGLVVVGDLIGSGDAQERGIVGETPNLAARLQSIAEPGQAVIAEDTRRLVGDLFELQDLGPQELKGIKRPVRAWAVRRPRSIESRFEAMHATRLGALVGRDEEAELLFRRWSRARDREGQVILLCGEAGIGKSRLTAALLDGLASEPHGQLRYFCSPQSMHSAFHPIIGQLERAAGLAPDDAPRAKLDKLDALLAQTSTPSDEAWLFGELLSLAHDGRHPDLALTPQQRRQRTLDALVAQIERLTHASPVLMIFEDTHWADPTSLEVLSRLIDRIRSLPVLLLVTFRPEFHPPWVSQAHTTNLTLNRLDHRAVSGIIESLVGDKEFPADVLAEIVHRTDGIPLFVEEMTKAVLEAESEGAARQTVASMPAPALAVPASLHASLMARLDRLGPAKELAQVGAAIGREFSHALLASVARDSEAGLHANLDRLIQAGLIFRRGVPPHATYMFNHALVQDAAYGTLLREPRRALHARIADALESRFPDLADSRPELLATHFTEAGLVEKAAASWGKAGQRSLLRSALVEAGQQLTLALGQIAILPSTPAVRTEEIKLQVALINALIHVKGFVSPETKAAVERARLLIEQAEARGEPPDDPLLLFWVVFAAGMPSFVTFNGDAQNEAAVQLMALAQKQESSTSLMLAHRWAAVQRLCAGDLSGSRAHFEKAIGLYDPAEHRPLAMRLGQDALVATLSYRSMASWLLGEIEQAAAETDQAISYARTSDHAATLLYALTITALYRTLSGNHAAAIAQLDEAFVLADEKGASFWKVTGAMLKGCALAAAGDAEDAVQMLTSAMTPFRATGVTLWMPSYLTILAGAYVELGRVEDGRHCIDEARRLIEASKERWYEPEVHRMAGEIALRSARRDTAVAEAHFDRALAIARGQRARSWELRAATSMAQLWHDLGRGSDARALLAPVVGSFTGTPETHDRHQAQQLLTLLGP